MLITFSENISAKAGGIYLDNVELLLILGAFVMGMLVVFLFKKTSASGGSSTANTLAAAAPPALSPAPSENADDEIIAVISAAIAAISSEEGKTYKISAITPRDKGAGVRTAWSVAGLMESTRPF